METVQAGVELSFEVSFPSPGLPVAMKVYDTTTGSPSLVFGPTAMVNLPSCGTYFGKFTPSDGHSYVVTKCVYTDGTFATLNDNYGQGSESIYALILDNVMVVGSSLVGTVDGTGSVCGTPHTFNIFQGDLKTMALKVVNEGCNTNPLNLTQCSEIDVALPNADGTIAHFLLSDEEVVILSPEVLGQLTVAISSEKSALLNPGVAQNFDVTFTLPGETITVRYFNGLSVFTRI